jgi:hypothetical protein
MRAERRGVLLLGCGCLLAVAALLVGWSEARGQVGGIPTTTFKPVVVSHAICQPANTTTCNECYVNVLTRPNGQRICVAVYCWSPVPLNYKMCAPANTEESCTVVDVIESENPCEQAGGCVWTYCSDVVVGNPNDSCEGCFCIQEGSTQGPSTWYIRVC